MNSNLSSDRFAPPSAPLGYGYSTKQNSVDKMKPAYSGKLVRVDLTDFSLSGVEVGALYAVANSNVGIARKRSSEASLSHRL